MKPDFQKSKFTTDYSFASIRSIVRLLSDAYSKQFCDTKGAIQYAAQATQGRCLYCGRKMYKNINGVPVFSNTIHFDHIYPASKMNLFTVGNVAIACESCNLAKSNVDPIDYYDIRTAEGSPLLIHERDDFIEFLDKITKPYQEEFPEHYEAGQRKYEDDEEFKEKMTELLYNHISIAASGRYNHENSVNWPTWKKVIDRAYETWAPLSAKDVEARIGYANEFFENYFTISTKLSDCSINELQDYYKELLLSKHESKSEVQKYRMLIRMLSEVLAEDLMSEAHEEAFKEVPTYKKLKGA